MLRLLYIDDDVAFSRLVSRALAAQEFEVVHAAHGDAGLEALAGGKFDAVALDHVMPGRSGPSTLAVIVASPESPPVVYVTAADEGRIAVMALKAGAADYVLKDAGESFFELLGETIRQAIMGQRVRQERARAQAEVAAARDRAEALLREVNHRVANSLALVSSFAHLQASGMPEGEGRDAVMDLKRRIIAVGQVHRRLYTSEDVGRVDLEQYLGGLVEELQASIGDESGVVDISLKAEPLQMPTDKAIAIGVILSELVTNACKYAYPDGTSGAVDIDLRRTADRMAELSVTDCGIGLGDEDPNGSGLGGRIVKAMAKSMKAGLDYPPRAKGTQAILRFPA